MRNRVECSTFHEKSLTYSCKLSGDAYPWGIMVRTHLFRLGLVLRKQF